VTTTHRSSVEILDELDSVLAEFAVNQRKIEALIGQMRATLGKVAEGVLDVRRILDQPLDA
jgi:hypothetical protein